MTCWSKEVIGSHFQDQAMCLSLEGHSYLNGGAESESQVSKGELVVFYGSDYSKPLIDVRRKDCVSLSVLGL